MLFLSWSCSASYAALSGLPEVDAAPSLTDSVTGVVVPFVDDSGFWAFAFGAAPLAAAPLDLAAGGILLGQGPKRGRRGRDSRWRAKKSWRTRPRSGLTTTTNSRPRHVLVLVPDGIREKARRSRTPAPG